MEITLEHQPPRHRKRQERSPTADATSEAPAEVTNEAPTLGPSQQKHVKQLKRLNEALVRLAYLVEMDEDFLPFFIRIEHEIELEKAKTDPLARARALAQRQKAMHSKKR